VASSVCQLPLMETLQEAQVASQRPMNAMPIVENVTMRILTLSYEFPPIGLTFPGNSLNPQPSESPLTTEGVLPCDLEHPLLSDLALHLKAPRRCSATSYRTSAGLCPAVPTG
jgi:hypothetical protein